jgi:hypothetical protein
MTMDEKIEGEKKKEKDRKEPKKKLKKFSSLVTGQAIRAAA